MNVNGKKAIVRSDCWVILPDGRRAELLYGEVYVVDSKDILGFKPSHSTNWFLAMGKEKNILIAGCQIHTMSISDTPPSNPDVAIID